MFITINITIFLYPLDGQRESGVNYEDGKKKYLLGAIVIDEIDASFLPEKEQI